MTLTARKIRLTEDLDLVVPAGRWMAPSVVNAIEATVEVADAGQMTGARALLAQLEDRLGVTPQDRFAASTAGPFLFLGDGSAITQTIRARKDLREKSQRARAVALSPRDEVPFSDQERVLMQQGEARLEEAQKHRRAGNHRLAKIRVQEARQSFMAVEVMNRSRSDAAWASRILKEIVALEEAIGGTVETIKAAGGHPMQVRSRDGLYTLASPPTKTLTEAQLSAGLSYRELYERTDPERSLRPPSIDPSDVRGGSGNAEAWAEKRERLITARREFDERVSAEVSPRALVVLHEVAGKGRCVSHIASGGKGRALDTARLLRALDLLADIYGLH